MDIREAVNSDYAKSLDTQSLRQHFLIKNLFQRDAIELTYSHVDRMIVGGCMPVAEAVSLKAGKAIGAEHFLARRELGAINVGGAGSVTVDGERHIIGPREALYIGMGAEQVSFASDSADKPAKFYFNSSPAHQTYPHKKITLEMANPMPLGAAENSNQRTIYQYIVPDVVETCQLLMGLTMLEPGSTWNTMPCHTHERRMEVYFYFDVQDDNVVFHMMGEPHETRHLVVRNEQAVLSPSWSIHTGVGSSHYTFIWGMSGENQIFTDMDQVPMSKLK